MGYRARLGHGVQHHFLYSKLDQQATVKPMCKLLMFVLACLAVSSALPVGDVASKGGIPTESSLPFPKASFTEIQACEGRLVPRFEKLGEELENTLHNYNETSAHLEHARLRTDFLTLMNKCLELSRDQSTSESELELALQSGEHARWGFVKKNIVDPVKKNVVDPVKKHVVDPATKWAANGPPAPPPGNPPQTYTSWKAVEKALALASVVYQGEEQIDWFLDGCPNPNDDHKLAEVIGKIDAASLKLMKNVCKIYTLFEKIAFLDNGKSYHGKDAGTEALFLVEKAGEKLLQLQNADVGASMPRKLLLQVSQVEDIPAGVEETEETDVQVNAEQDASSSRRRRRRWHRWHVHHRHHWHHWHHRHHSHHWHHRHHSHHRHHRHHSHHSHHRHTPQGKAEAIWIVFRGTESGTDWAANIQTITTKWNDGGGGNVHQGFY